MEQGECRPKATRIEPFAGKVRVGSVDAADGMTDRRHVPSQRCDLRGVTSEVFRTGSQADYACVNGSPVAPQKTSPVFKGLYVPRPMA
jgi:hypothetical protein